MSIPNTAKAKETRRYMRRCDIKRIFKGEEPIYLGPWKLVQNHLGLLPLDIRRAVQKLLDRAASV